MIGLWLDNFCSNQTIMTLWMLILSIIICHVTIAYRHCQNCQTFVILSWNRQLNGME